MYFTIYFAIFLTIKSMLISYPKLNYNNQFIIYKQKKDIKNTKSR
jgi:hypothetical protein